MTANEHKGAKFTFHFDRPEKISPVVLDQIQHLIKEGAAVGSSYLEDNLHSAFLIGYAMDQNGRAIGTVTLKHPKEVYRKKIEALTGLDLSEHLERGYTSVASEWRNFDIADGLIKGLIERSAGQKIYVTIRMDNWPALELTYKNRMALAATFFNQRTRHEIGVFLNHSVGDSGDRKRAKANWL